MGVTQPYVRSPFNCTCPGSYLPQRLGGAILQPELPSCVSKQGQHQGELRCSDSSGSYREVPTVCNVSVPRAVWRARFPAHWKSAVRKRGSVERFVENQRPSIGPCGLVRVPAGSCGKIRTPAGSGWGGTLRQTYVTQRLTTASNSCGKVRNPAPTANNPTSSHLRLASAMCRESAASSIPVCGIEPASASTHPTFDQAVTNLSRKARRPWS